MKKYIIIPILSLILAACSFGQPWSQERTEKLRQEFCVDLMEEQPYSKSCDCFVAATLSNFKTFTSYARASGPSEQYRKDLEWCGYLLKP